jgi:hypothetical protein
MQNIAESHNGKCLSKIYKGNHFKLKWKCNKGHIWSTSPSCIKNRCWCPECSKLKKLTIEEMQNIAKNHGGQCLSKIYNGNKSKLKWKCNKGHVWFATPFGIKINKNWCPHCSGNIRLTIEEMKKIAISKNGKCLSDKYINTNTKLEWECKEGHRWLASSVNIRQGYWCSECVKVKKLTIEEMKKIALLRKGKCLSNKYINSNTKLKWECNKEHQWWAQPSDIKNGHWCYICAKKITSDKHRLTIKHAKKLALKRKGKCISNEYITSKDLLLWKCKNNHIWSSSYNSIKAGSWCPYCHEFKHEKTCRNIFEKIFDKKFPKTIHPKIRYKKPLQFDGYNKSLNLAFEYNGKQHYEFINFFHRNKKDFYKQKLRDIIKNKKCKELGINLITIPYNQEDNLEEFIRNELIQTGEIS